MSGSSSHKSTSIKVTTAIYLSYVLRPPLLWGWMDWGIVGDSTMGRLWIVVQMEWLILSLTFSWTDTLMTQNPPFPNGVCPPLLSIYRLYVKEVKYLVNLLEYCDWCETPTI